MDIYLIMKKNLYLLLAVTLLLASCSHPKQRGLTFVNDFESVKGWSDVLLATGPVHSGKFSNRLDSLHPYGLTFSLPFKNITPLHLRKVKVSMWVYLTEGANGSLVMDVKTPERSTVFWAGEDFTKHAQPGSWQKVSVEFSLQNNSFNVPTNIIGIYPWNSGKKEFYIDDVEIEFVQGL